MDVNNPSGDARSAWRAALNNPFACWALARSQRGSMIQVLITVVALGGCALIVGVVPFDEKLPLVFRVLVVFCALVAMLSLAYLSIHQAWPWVRAWLRRREENRRREEAVPLAGQADPPASLLPLAARSLSFVYSSAASNPLPENPPAYRHTPTPPRCTSSPLCPRPTPRPIFVPTPPPPFPILPLPLGFPTRPTAPEYDPNPSLTSLETALRDCYYHDQAREPLVRESRPPSPVTFRGVLDEHSNGGSDKEDAV